MFVHICDFAVIKRLRHRIQSPSGCPTTTSISFGLFGPGDQGVPMIPGYGPSELKCVTASNSCVFIHPSRLFAIPSSCPAVQAVSLCIISTLSVTESTRLLHTDTEQQILEQVVRGSSIASQSPTSHSGSTGNGKREFYLGFFILSLIFTNATAFVTTIVEQYVRHLLHS